MARKPSKKQSGFELTSENSKILKHIVETLASIIDETEIIITPKELTIKAMDPSRICLLKVNLEKNDFSEYKCSEVQKVGINLSDLDKIMKRATVGDTIILSFNPKEEKLKIKMKKKDAERAKVFTLSSMNLEVEDIKIDNLLGIDYTAFISIEPALLQEAIKDAEIYSEVIQVAVSEESLNFHAIGQIGDMEYELSSEDFSEFNVSEKTSGAYSIDFLKSILKLNTITEKLAISLKEDHPIRLEFNIIEGGKATFFLAPRISEVPEEEEFIEAPEFEGDYEGIEEEPEEEADIIEEHI